MSEQKSNYMATLNEWTDFNIIIPITDAVTEYLERQDKEDDGEDAVNAVYAEIKKSIREKVLESYRNGQAAKPKESTWKK